MSDHPLAHGVGRFEWERAFRAVPKDRPLTPAVIAVAFALSTFATFTTGADAKPSQATLAAAVGVHRVTVTQGLAGLASLGWIAVTATAQGRPNTYQLTIPNGRSPQATPGAVPGLHPGSPPAAGGAVPGLQNMSTTSALTSTKTSTSEPQAFDPWAEVEAEEAAAAAAGRAFGL